MSEVDRLQPSENSETGTEVAPNPSFLVEQLRPFAFEEYQGAASLTGCRFEVIAHEGEAFETTEGKSARVSPGLVAVRVTRGGEWADFWRERARLHAANAALGKIDDYTTH